MCSPSLKGGLLVQGLRTRSLTRSGLFEVLATSGSTEYVLAWISTYTARAAAAVRHVSPTPMKVALLEIPGSIVRTRSERSAKIVYSEGVCTMSR